ncbi:MAG: hypothetical protein JNG85_15750, partial [Spirochaetaceae bacterium]|nr:hypothetical protein [Spirochaetaceae bacterium]
SLPRLLATMEETGADIVGARAPYMESAEDAADPAAFAARQPAMDGELVDRASLRARFDRPTAGPVEAPFVHAAFLVSRELAARIGFDEEYTGNCYREETDFLVRARAGGARIFFEPQAVQANLPRAEAGGGAHGGSGSFLRRKLAYFDSAARNNWRFLKKNDEALEKALGVRRPAFFRQALFLFDIAKVIAGYPLRKLAERAR